MEPNLIVTTVLSLGGIALVAGIVLDVAARKFAVFEDPLIGEIEGILPGANCGGCGAAGCHAFAEEIVATKDMSLSCPVGGPDLAGDIAAKMGLEAIAGQRMVAGADAVELKVYLLSSNPNITGPELEETAYELLERVRERATIPVSLKFGYPFSALSAFLFRLSHSGVKGLVLFNRPFFPDFDVEKLELTTGRYVSAPGEYQMPLRWVSMVSGRLGCEVCASTGIHSGETAVKLLLAGANAVQVVSVLYDQGFEVIGRMNDDIRAWMERHHCSRIEEFRGRMRQVDSPNPAAYERVQFMRHTAGLE